MGSVNSRRNPLAALALIAALACWTACTDEAPGAGGGADAALPDGGSKAGDGGAPADGGGDVSVSSAPPPIECFKGTPRTNEEFLNACWPDTTTALTRTATLPGGYKPGDPLPPPP